ncbi:MAG: hypothetical protein PHH70_05200 [Candidatus Gracilibacteria bacterium]|nr:hypothetical protein [Candidatus Gracilibacteria bacterium]
MELNIETITTGNLAALDDVYKGILEEIDNGNTGTPVVETPKFSEVPHFKSLIAQRHHDVLCFSLE